MIFFYWIQEHLISVESVCQHIGFLERKMNSTDVCAVFCFGEEQ